MLGQAACLTERAARKCMLGLCMEGTFVSNPCLWEDEVLAFHRPSELGLPGVRVRAGPS